MPFRRYVTVGRVAYVNLAEDPLYGKLVVIVDVLDQNRVRLRQMRWKAGHHGLRLRRAGLPAPSARRCGRGGCRGASLALPAQPNAWRHGRASTAALLLAVCEAAAPPCAAAGHARRIERLP